MAGANKTYMVDIDLDKSGIHRSFCNRPIGRKDKDADHFGVNVFRNGEAFTLSGIQIQGYFINPIGEHIAITDSDHCIRNGNSGWVILPQACYNYEGQFQLSLKLVGGGVTGTVRIIDGTVCNTGADGAVAPTNAVPTYQEVLAEYNEAVEMTDSFNELKDSLMIKYVDARGSDGNDGNGPSVSGDPSVTKNKAYATIGKALSTGARVIYVARGTYNEYVPQGDLTAYRYGGLRLIGDRAVWNGGDKACIALRFVNVYISGFDFVAPEVTGATSGAISLLRCTGEIVDCTASGATNGFQLISSSIKFTKCKAFDNSNDGFNGRTDTDNHPNDHCHCVFTDCEAYGNGDDGLSIHQHGSIEVIGGKYHDNNSGGITPWQWCEFEIIGAQCYGNGIGIEVDNSSWQTGCDKGHGRIVGCICTGNNKSYNPDISGQLVGYGIYVDRYNVDALANSVSGNNRAQYYQGTEGELTIHQITTA